LKKLLAVFLFLFLVFACSDDNEPEEPTEDLKVIGLADINGVKAPVAGEIPVLEINQTSQYTGTVSWEPDHTVFEVSVIYTATIIVTEKEGYTFKGVSKNFFNVSGAQTSNDADSGTVKAVFPVTNFAIVTLTDISGVITPKAGETPARTITATSQFTGTVSWQPDHDVFDPSVQYTAVVNIVPEPDYTLNGVKMNHFKIASAAAVFNAASGNTVKAIFSPEAGPVITKWIAFTFDDGPTGNNTVQLLDHLKNYNIKATFFTIGENFTNAGRNGPVNRMIEEGHEFGNHTWNHSLSGLTKEQIRTNIQNTSNAIKAKTGKDPVLFRTPGGNGSATLNEVITEMGLPFIGFNIDTQDWNEATTTQSIIDNVLRNAKDGTIILMHDFGNNNSRPAVPEIAAELQKQGYGFVTVSDLALIKNRVLESGKNYNSL